MYRRATYLLTLIVILCCSVPVFSQSITGRISGTVTDSTGAVVPGITITATNEATGESRVVQTDAQGFYVLLSLLPGSYKVTAEKAGFKKLVKTGNTLTADGRLTSDFVLEAGEVSEAVEIVAESNTVNTVSGESARTIDGGQVRELALNGRNYMQLTTLIPGAPAMSDDQLGLMTSLSIAQNINGSRNNANTTTIDGTLNAVSGSYGSQINNVGIDFVQEVEIKSSNFSAEYGRKSGASINVVTRRGTNEYHGSAWEFLRNDAFDANSFTNNANNLKNPPLRYNNFGWSLGGPIKKDKLLFFAGMEWKYIRRTADKRATLPTLAELTGDFSQRLKGPDGIVGNDDDGVLRNPAFASTTCAAPVFDKDGKTITKAAIRTGCYTGNKLPVGSITSNGQAIANVFNAMRQQAASFTDTPTQNNTAYQMPNPFNYRQEIFRLDYSMNEKHSIYGRYIHDSNIVVDPYGTFIDSGLPTIQSSRNRPGHNIQATHTWLLSSSLVNEAKVGAAWASQRIPPATDDWMRSNYGFTYSEVYPGGGKYAASIPNVSFAGNGNYSGFSGANASLLAPSTDISFSDTLSIVKQAHTIKVGATYIRNRVDQNARTNYSGSLAFNPTGNEAKTTGNAFADALLGNFRTYSEAQNDQLGFFRFSQVESFASDSWKINRRLSIEAGVRYQFLQPTFTQANNGATFDPALYDASKAVTILNNGNIDTTKGGNRFIGLVRLGDGVPSDELGRVPNANDAIVQAVPSGALRGVYKSQHLFAPRFSFAYAPGDDGKTSIRGGFGTFYDRPEGNLVFSLVSVPPYTLSSQYSNSNIDTYLSGASVAAPFGDLTVIDPNLKNPYTMNFSLGVQREMPYGVLLETTYVGSLSRHLLRRPDINQASFADLAANAALPTAQRKATNALRPYKGYAAINYAMSDTNSNYNALQLYATKRKGDVRMTASYTWSKSLSDTRGGNFEGPEDPTNRGYSYGPTDFDRRHILVLTYTYDMPSFKGQSRYIRSVAGGWELSGITRFQTGQYLTVTGDTNIGVRRADYNGQDLEGPQTIAKWFNTAAYTIAPTGRRGNAGIGMIQGPGRYLWDISMRKQFAVGEKVRFQLQGDFFNIFNQVNLGNPNTRVDQAAFGQITGSAPGRNIQIGLRLSY